MSQWHVRTLPDEEQHDAVHQDVVAVCAATGAETACTVRFSQPIIKP
jgi:hypothetical protein